MQALCSHPLRASLRPPRCRESPLNAKRPPHSPTPVVRVQHRSDTASPYEAQRNSSSAGAPTGDARGGGSAAWLQPLHRRHFPVSTRRDPREAGPPHQPLCRRRVRRPCLSTTYGHWVRLLGRRRDLGRTVLYSLEWSSGMPFAAAMTRSPMQLLLERWSYSINTAMAARRRMTEGPHTKGWSSQEWPLNSIRWGWARPKPLG